jgi:hypothetical protein
MITIITKTECIMFNLGTEEKQFCALFEQMKTYPGKHVRLLNVSPEPVDVIPAESEVIYEDREYIEADGEAIEVLTNQISRG